ncbi:MAG TPA: hypothetical protein V6C58_23240, partial [Allocoleopsis sp.]
KFNINKKIKKSRRNEVVKKAIKKIVGNDDIDKYKYSINAVLDEERRQYTNTQFQTFDDIDIEESIENYLNEYSVGNVSSTFDKFYVYVSKNYAPNQGGTDDKNDCLYNAIFTSYNFDVELMPNKINKPHKLKKYLELQRNDKVCISKLKELEEILNCSFEVSGEAEYISNVLKPKHIKMTLMYGHYKFIQNNRQNVLSSGVRYKNVNEANIYTFTYNDDNVKIFNGEEETIISRNELKEMQNNKDYLLIFIKAGDLIDERNKYIKKAKYFYEKYGEMINFYKSQYHSQLNYKNILQKLQGTQKPDEISNHEAYVIDKAFRGGLRFHTKGEFENVYDYDINTMYAHYLTCGLFTFPILKPEYQTIKVEDFKTWSCYQYGFYYCKPLNTHKFFEVKNVFSWYNHFDLQVFKLLNIDFEIKETDNNHLFYSSEKRINGKIFKKYVDELYKIKCNCPEEYKDDVKLFLSSIYGSMCKKNTNTQYATFQEPLDIENNLINSIEPTEKGAILETIDINNIFSTDYARVSFITAYCRYKMIQILINNVKNFDNIIHLNTDGFTTKTEIKTLPISSEIGKFKVKKYSKFIIHHLSKIDKIV